MGGEERGKLLGLEAEVNAAVTENIDLAGTPTTQGLKALAAAYPALDAPSVQVQRDGAMDRDGITMTALSIPAGESSKGWPQFERCVEWLLEQKIERRDVVVAFGGGVVGDLVGFAAAVLRRGVRFVQMPTTLLALRITPEGGSSWLSRCRISISGSSVYVRTTPPNARTSCR